MSEAHHWFEAVADHLGPAYLRYSFTKGTVREVDALIDLTGLSPGHRVLDVGCGPGRHALELARRGIDVVGVDVSTRFLELARDAARAEELPARFVRADARALPVTNRFDAVMSMCQGGFGLLGGAGDLEAFAAMAGAVAPGGWLVLSAFSAYFQVRWLEENDTFDLRQGVNRETTVIRDEAGTEVDTVLWTTCFTPRELELMAAAAGLTVLEIRGAITGDWSAAVPDFGHPELLLVARRS